MPTAIRHFGHPETVKCPPDSPRKPAPQRLSTPSKDLRIEKENRRAHMPLKKARYRAKKKRAERGGEIQKEPEEETPREKAQKGKMS